MHLSHLHCILDSFSRDFKIIHVDDCQKWPFRAKKGHFLTKKWQKIEILRKLDQKGAKRGILIWNNSSKGAFYTLWEAPSPRGTAGEIDSHFLIFGCFRAQIWLNPDDFRDIQAQIWWKMTKMFSNPINFLFLVSRPNPDLSQNNWCCIKSNWPIFHSKMKKLTFFTLWVASGSLSRFFVIYLVG